VDKEHTIVPKGNVKDQFHALLEELEAILGQVRVSRKLKNLLNHLIIFVFLCRSKRRYLLFPHPNLVCATQKCWTCWLKTVFITATRLMVRYFYSSRILTKFGSKSEYVISFKIIESLHVKFKILCCTLQICHNLRKIICIIENAIMLATTYFPFDLFQFFTVSKCSYFNAIQRWPIKVLIFKYL
jgi:hypothetical protein